MFQSKRTRVKLTAAMLAIVGAGTGAGQAIVPAAVRSPLLRPFDGRKHAAIEDYAGYDGQTKCSRNVKPGTYAFSRMLLRKYGYEYMSIKRSCAGDSVSEHKEGRAIDWGVNAFRRDEKAKAKDLIQWLMATDRFGNPHARARRLGVMYIIWNRRMWRAYRPKAGWLPYDGHPHTDHMHISFSRPGGLGLTSYWTGTVADIPG